MSNEDKMRDAFADFDAGFTSNNEIYRAAVFGWDSGVEACAAIKDAEIAELNLCMDENNKVINEQAREIVAQAMMIKELREAALRVEASPYSRSGIEFIKAMQQLKEVLSKTEHHNSSELEKMLMDHNINIVEKLLTLKKQAI